MDLFLSSWRGQGLLRRGLIPSLVNRPMILAGVPGSGVSLDLGKPFPTASSNSVAQSARIGGVSKAVFCYHAERPPCMSASKRYAPRECPHTQ